MDRFPRNALEVVCAAVGGLGIALLVALFLGFLIENVSVERIAASVAFLLGVVGLWLWFRSQPGMVVVLRGVRQVLVVQFIVFAIVGIVVALANLVDLFT